MRAPLTHSWAKMAPFTYAPRLRAPPVAGKAVLLRYAPRLRAPPVAGKAVLLRYAPRLRAPPVAGKAVLLRYAPRLRAPPVAGKAVLLRYAPRIRAQLYLPAAAARRFLSSSWAKYTLPSFTTPMTAFSRRKASWVCTSFMSNFLYGWFQVAMTPWTGSFKSSRASLILCVSALPACFTAAAKT